MGEQAGTEVVLGVTGSIGAYKAADLVRRLTEQDMAVTCVLTKEAAEFIGPLTLRALSGRPVHSELFDLNYQGVIHTDLADRARLLIVAPATAHTIAKLALGLADDLLTCIALATRAPILIAPAMNVQMYTHPVTQQHVARLRQLGCRFVGPVEGSLACGYDAVGHIAEPEEIVRAAQAILGGRSARLAPRATSRRR
jgi:phosphopantothenoylcysteine synthetase/decarboxylase